VALRALPAQQLLEAASKPGVPRFAPTLDGYFFTQMPTATFAAGQQARVPLLVGWNSQEMSHPFLLGQEPPTPDNFRKAVQKLYPERAEEVLKLYPANTPQEAEQAATDLAGDRFIAYSTWKLADMQSQTSGQPVYRYLYARPRPAMNPTAGNVPAARGAAHSAEIEYALGNLPTNKVYAWTPDDYKVSEMMQNYFANFIKTGNPNSPGLPTWPATKAGGNSQVMRIDVKTGAEPDQHRARYLLLDQLFSK
jgi:para-nitrobenzyl esterase